MSHVPRGVKAVAINYGPSVDKTPTERNIFSAPIYGAISETNDQAAENA